MATAAIRRYWTQVAALGCVICGGPAEIAHAHNGSIRLRMQEPKAKGKKLARYDWLVLPLCPHHHGLLDLGGARAWEGLYGTQAMWIDRIIQELGMPVWDLAKVGSKTMPRVSVAESTVAVVITGDADQMEHVK